MNFKTTAVLTALLIALLAWFMIAKPQQAPPAETKAAPSPETLAQQPVLKDAPELESIVAVTATRAGEPPWRFERTNPDGPDDKAEWKMTQPIDTKVQKWEIDNIVRTVKDLKYQIKYASSDANAVKRADAGLEPPRIEIKLDAKGGKSYTIQIGKPASISDAYVATDPDAVYVVQQSFEFLLKKNPNQYRDTALVQFPANDAVSMTIKHRPDSGDVVEYQLVKHGTDWVFEKPFVADADDKAISDAITSASRLRAAEWIDRDPAEGLSRFGLASSRVEVDITTQESAPTPAPDAAKLEDDAQPEPPAPVIKHYGFALSASGPLGKDAQVYAKLADNEGIAAVTKSIADKFVPVPEKWRDMKLSPSPLTDANRVELRVAGVTSVMIKNDNNQWVFEDSGAPAEQTEIEGLLKTLSDLKALNFVDGADPADPTYGLAKPRAEIKVSLPGHDQPESFTLGNPTDEVAKRVYYFRRGASSVVAKIRAADAAVLERNPADFLNHEINKIAISDIEKIEIATSSPGNVVVVQGGESKSRNAVHSVTLEKKANQWFVTSPIEAPADVAAATRVASVLGALHAERVAAAKGDPREFGLDNPTVRIALAYKGPTVIKAGADAPPPAPEIKTIAVDLADKGGKVYAKRADNPAIYELRRTDYEALTADLHDKNIFKFESPQAKSVSVTVNGATYAFEKRGAAWVYQSEPDLPIDPKKVENLLVQMKDLKLTRYTDHGVEKLAGFGLDNPAKIVKVTLEEDRTITLLISAKVCPDDPQKSVYAAVEGTGDVFLLTPDTVSRFDIKLADFEKAAGT